MLEPITDPTRLLPTISMTTKREIFADIVAEAYERHLDLIDWLTTTEDYR